MKLLLDEIVHHSDADHVLRTLEPFLREVSLETVRTDDELIAYGLGPSFRTMNPRDKTIVRATSQPTATTLHTEANFLASALAGNAAQDEIVRSKIERAFESMRTELSYGAVSPPLTAATLPAAESASPGPAMEAVPAIAASAPLMAEAISPEPIESTANAVETPSIEAKPEPLPEAKIEPEARMEPLPVTKPAPLPVAKIESKPEPRIQPTSSPKIDDPVLTAVRRSAPVPFALMMEEAPGGKKRSAILWVLPLLILLLAAAAFYLLPHRHASQNNFAAKAEDPVASASVENRAAAPVAAPTPAAMPTDVKEWVQAWAATIGTRDVQAQMAFYSTPLDRYFLASNVSRDQLLKDKQAEIADRKGVWTFKAEDVEVRTQTPTNAVVYLNKHVVEELPSSTVREQHLKAQLKLKMVDGAWKIVSERTIG